MDRFKRKQSQVFWRQMENRDLGVNYDRERIKYSSGSVEREVNIERIGEENVGFRERTEEEYRRARGRCYEEERTSRVDGISPIVDVEEDDEEEEEEDTRKETRRESSSPTSWCAGQRSQDSGFSDSERSADSDIGSRAGSLRRTRNKRSRGRRSKVELATSSPWMPEERPQFTSTPNKGTTDPRRSHDHRDFRSSKPQQILRNEDHSLDARLAVNEDARIPRFVEVSLSLEDADECFGDFLYATEPPEDSPTRQASGIIRDSQRSSAHRHGGPEESSNVYGSTNVTTAGMDRETRVQHLEAVRFWLEELASVTDVECHATLQSKSLPRRDAERDYPTDPGAQTRDITLLTASATAAATKLLARADRFQQRFQSGLEEIRKLRGHDQTSERSLAVQSIEEDAFLLLSELGAPQPRRVEESGSCKDVIKQLKHLAKDTYGAIDARLDFYIERVVRGLEEAPGEGGGSVTRGALAALTVLGMRGPRSGRSVARCLGVRALLTTLLSIRRRSIGSSETRCACLRALASVCCCPEGVEQLVENAGPEILAELLSDSRGSPEVERMEAAALIVQITAPWMNGFGLPSLEPFAATLVRSLTDLAAETRCGQTLLLAAAALNNLSKSSPFVVPIVENSTVSVLLKSVKRSEGGNVWLMEQVAALIGELARTPNVRGHLAEARASVALVCFLRMRPPGFESAYRKLEATASAALARLCVEERVARQLVTVGGTRCLPYRNLATEGRCTRSLRLAYKRATAQVDAAAAASAKSDVTSDF